MTAPSEAAADALVGVVVVSHSARLAEGVVELARQMAGPDLTLIPVGGASDGSLGTDADRILLRTFGIALLYARHMNKHVDPVARRVEKLYNGEVGR